MADLTYTPPEVSSIVGLVETYLRHREMNGPDRGYEIYHPSAFGKCLRLMQYQRYEARGLIKGEKEQFGGRMLRLFANGHDMHARWASYFEDLGVLRGVWECTNPLCRMFNDAGRIQTGIELNDPSAYARNVLADPKKFPTRKYGEGELQGCLKPAACKCGHTKLKYHEVLVEDKELNFKGHADMLLDFREFDASRFDDAEKEGLTMFFDKTKLPKGLIVVDMKTVGTNSYKNTVLKTGAHKYYQVQLTIYVNVLKCDFGLLIYEEKDQFELSTFKIEQNPGAWAQIRRQAIIMQEMVNSDKPLLPPPRPISKSSYDCKDCAFKSYCHRPGGIWDDPDLEQKRKDFYGDLL